MAAREEARRSDGTALPPPGRNIGTLIEKATLFGYFEAVGAKKDKDGAVLIYNSQPVSFMGKNEEYLIGADMTCIVNDKPVNVLDGLLANGWVRTAYALF